MMLSMLATWWDNSYCNLLAYLIKSRLIDNDRGSRIVAASDGHFLESLNSLDKRFFDKIVFFFNVVDQFIYICNNLRIRTEMCRKSIIGSCHSVMQKYDVLKDKSKILIKTNSTEIYL